MNNIKSTIWGLAVGAIFGLVVGGFTAFGAEGDENGKGFDCYFTASWNEMRSCDGIFEWSDVFSGLSYVNDEGVGLSNAGNLYQLVYQKLQVDPNLKAAKAVAESLDMTEDEVLAIMGGSVNTAWETSSGATVLSKNEALNRLNSIQGNFNNAKELFEMQAEVDSSVAPSELFSNGDVNDSGFDLVYDLSAIESILFNETSEVSVGEKYDNETDSPLPPDADNSNEENESQKDSPAGGGSEGGKPGVPVIVETESGIKANITLGNDQITANVLEEEVCEEEEVGGISDALDEYNQKIENESGTPEDEELTNSESTGGGDDAGGDNSALDQVIEPAPPAEWGSVFCPGFGGEGPERLEIASSSIGGAGEDFEDLEEGYFRPSVSVCITLEFIKGKVSSSADTQCIQCEVRKINEYFDDLFQHSLVPNKVTGNLMESAKCKIGISSPITDIKIIPITVPVKTPEKDDLIFEKNIFGEWNKFIDRLGWQYESDGVDGWIAKSLISPLRSDARFIEQFEFNYPSGTTNVEILNSLQSNLELSREEILEAEESAEAINTASDDFLYGQSMRMEITRFRTNFEQFQNNFKKINNESCEQLYNKKSVQDG